MSTFGQRTASITTRIKTAPVLEPYEKKSGQRTASITTRIKTSPACSTSSVSPSVREQHPLQQGLRPAETVGQFECCESENSIHYNKD